ncbi:transcriptional repressor [Parapedobacter koreensis]|uniref:Ferric uptake regulator family protein n=1 Tax=Parapedobacter koreensis TaxID=332977 RepID=A0A1H7EX54_9SPHI|nr:transcriptional repressor [Parapedobacter koreensis]SEK18473.1 Ferric uptake regulator family protein [Parapedobacter koreensis]
MEGYTNVVDNDAGLAAQICSLIQARGLHLNPPRKEVICALCRQQEPVTAETLWLDICAMKRISISAVYTNLNMLVREGIAKRIHRPRAKSHYALRLQTSPNSSGKC